jgi:hypothetical protein
MDSISAIIYVSILLGILIFWRIGVFHRIVEAVQYIRLNGWAEYRAARRRYDEHTRLENQAMPTKDERRQAKKQMIKRDKMRRRK